MSADWRIRCQVTVKSDIACIAELLGETARKKGVTCPCAKCQEKQGAGIRDQGLGEKPIPNPKSPIPDAKQRAAHDVPNGDE